MSTTAELMATQARIQLCSRRRSRSVCRRQMNPIRDRLDAAMFSSAAMELIDTADMTGEATPTCPLHQAQHQTWKTGCKDQRDVNRQSWEFDAHSVNVSIGRDPETGSQLALPFTGCQECRKAFAISQKL